MPEDSGTTPNAMIIERENSTKLPRNISEGVPRFPLNVSNDINFHDEYSDKTKGNYYAKQFQDIYIISFMTFQICV